MHVHILVHKKYLHLTDNNLHCIVISNYFDVLHKGACHNPVIIGSDLNVNNVINKLADIKTVIENIINICKVFLA